jgi:erythromycin esterase-like protein
MLDAVYPRTSGYLRARLADQFDALIHFDETRSLEPLDTTF